MQDAVLVMRQRGGVGPAVRGARVPGGDGNGPGQTAHELLSVLTHELRSPLATLMTTADLLAEGFYDLAREDAQALLLRMQRSASWLQGVLDNMSVVARLDARQLRLFPAVVALPTCLETVTAVVQPYLEQRKQTLRCVGLPWDLVWGDERCLTQILVNLLNNAIKYGNPESEIRLIGERQGKWVKLTVHNDGPGVLPADCERVFERYERGKAAVLSGSPGLGLGLYIVKRLVELQDGQVGVDSTPGDGASFWFTLRSYSG